MKLPKIFWPSLAAAALLGSAALQAQQVYRIVGPDGRVTYSDQPPASADGKAGSSTTLNSATPARVSNNLPFELAQVASRYPVILYTGNNCNPCNAARQMLTARGVPFTEKTVTTQPDGEALQRLSGDTSLPFATLGAQQLKGFSDLEWSQYLDAAGYPKSSVLPASYRNAPPTPLVTVQPAQTAPAAAGAPADAENAANRRRVQPPPEAAPAENPAGIRF